MRHERGTTDSYTRIRLFWEKNDGAIVAGTSAETRAGMIGNVFWGTTSSIDSWPLRGLVVGSRR